MDNFDVKLDIEPKDNYGKAKQAISQAMEAISKLSPVEQDRLARELLTAETYNLLISFLQRR
jgi:hypothetical protein